VPVLLRLKNFELAECPCFLDSKINSYIEVLDAIVAPAIKELDDLGYIFVYFRILSYRTIHLSTRYTAHSV
jgi:hypothetical protein